ncbi:MAG: HAD-IA family hydrolase [Hyphomicrobiales bacterium]|nr:HAD-IA family hydrolase [Hyphomicrobiales bacterium]
MPLHALIFDVDGTLAETEELHREAFNQTFNEFDLAWHWNQERYHTLLKITGGKERMLAHAASLGIDDFDPLPLHKRKTTLYNEMLAQGAISLRPGVEALIRKAKEKDLRLAIATTTSRENVETLIRVTLGGDPHHWFEAISTGEDVAIKKPDPEVYQVALSRLELTARDAIAFEDTKNGVLAARGAGLDVIVTPSLYSAGEDFSGALAIIETLEAHNLSALDFLSARLGI